MFHGSYLNYTGNLKVHFSQKLHLIAGNSAVFFQGIYVHYVDNSQVFIRRTYVNYAGNFPTFLTEAVLNCVRKVTVIILLSFFHFSVSLYLTS